jgi:hypothetical protein
MNDYFNLMQFYTLHHAIETLDEKLVKKIYRDPVDYDIDKERMEKFINDDK